MDNKVNKELEEILDGVSLSTDGVEDAGLEAEFEGKYLADLTNGMEGSPEMKVILKRGNKRVAINLLRLLELASKGITESLTSKSPLLQDVLGLAKHNSSN